MKPTQNTVVHGLLGGAVPLAILLLYMVLAHHGQPALPRSGWILFGGIALAIMVTLVGCALAFFGVFFEMWWLMAFAIMLAPLSFIWRDAQKHRDRGNVGRDPPGGRQL